MEAVLRGQALSQPSHNPAPEHGDPDQGVSNAIDQGGKLALAGGVAAAVGVSLLKLQDLLKKHEAELFRRDSELRLERNAHHATKQEAAETIAKLEKSVAAEKEVAVTLREQAEGLEFIEKYNLRPGAFDEALKEFNAEEDMDKNNCMTMLLDAIPEDPVESLGPIESRGKLWNQAIRGCHLPEKLFIHPREKILVGENRHNEGEFVGGYPKEKDSKEKDQSKFNFASVRSLVKDRFMSLATTLGGAVRKARGSGMPAGITAGMPSYGSLPVGVGVY
ncbi:MAG: hypothetical protein M1816_005817 [Peltula sp. TS41687]|nr:MAG: hypothetical protein M1816_005817 [Peltula sp. TS41687]